MASETTAAATGAVGVVRRDPMAMRPFCGYNMADYWQHWLDMGEKLPNAPKIFNVNWFRTDDNGRFLWPGFGDNLRVLEWILKRCFDEVGADETVIGYEPKPEDINLDGSGVTVETLRELLTLDAEELARKLRGHPRILRAVRRQVAARAARGTRGTGKSVCRVNSIKQKNPAVPSGTAGFCWSKFRRSRPQPFPKKSPAQQSSLELKQQRRRAIRHDGDDDAPAVTTPSAIGGKASLTRISNMAAMSEPVHAPVPGSGMATK